MHRVESKRALFQRKLSRGDHAVMQDIFRERKEAQKDAEREAKMQQRPSVKLAQPPQADGARGTPNLTHSKTEPKLVKR